MFALKSAIYVEEKKNAYLHTGGEAWQSTLEYRLPEVCLQNKLISM